MPCVPFPIVPERVLDPVGLTGFGDAVFIHDLIEPAQYYQPRIHHDSSSFYCWNRGTLVCVCVVDGTRRRKPRLEDSPTRQAVDCCNSAPSASTTRMASATSLSFVEMETVPAGWCLETVVDALAFLMVAHTFDTMCHRQTGIQRALTVAQESFVERWCSEEGGAEMWVAWHQEVYKRELKTMQGWEPLQCLLYLHSMSCVKKATKVRYTETGLASGNTFTEGMARTFAGLEFQDALWQRWALCIEKLRCHKWCRNQMKDLRRRLAAAEEAALESANNLQAVQDENAKRTVQCEELANCLAAAEAVASQREHELQALQAEFAEYKETCEPPAGRKASGEDVSATDAGLQALLDIAMYKERCQQLKVQLTKAEVEASTRLDQIRALWIENATYKERLHQAELQLHKADRSKHASRLPFPQEPSSGEDSNMAEQLGYTLIGDGTSSVLSSSSWFSVKPECFMLHSIFKTRTYGMDFFLMGKDLKKGSQVVAADDKTILEVSEPPQVCRASEVVHLQAGAATLEVTPDHFVLTDGLEGGAGTYVPAGTLKVGDLVMLDSGEPVPLTRVSVKATDCEVLKIAFDPDLPVAVFSCPPSILSKGQEQRIKPKKVRRARMCFRGQGHDQTADGGVSIPKTVGEYTD